MKFEKVSIFSPKIMYRNTKRSNRVKDAKALDSCPGWIVRVGTKSSHTEDTRSLGETR